MYVRIHLTAPFSFIIFSPLFFEGPMIRCARYSNVPSPSQQSRALIEGHVVQLPTLEIVWSLRPNQFPRFI